VAPGVPHAARDGEAVHVREHDVEHHEIGLEVAHELPRAVAVGCRVHLEAGEAQGCGQQLADVRLVVDDDEPGLRGRGRGHAASVRPDAGGLLDSFLGGRCARARDGRRP